MFLNLYKSIVHLHVEYVVTVRMLLYKKDMVAIENVKRRVTKLVRTISHLVTYQKGLDRDKFFTNSNYTATRGHSMKFAKRRHRLKVRYPSHRLMELSARKCNNGTLPKLF